MNKSGVGIGSASVVLVFAVLCLTVFALITYTAAGNDKALADVEAGLVKNYYAADTMAERILAELLAAETILSGSMHGVEITVTRAPGQMVEFSCPVSAERELHVKAAIYEDSYDILSWRMRSTGEWEAGDGLPVWPGE